MAVTVYFSAIGHTFEVGNRVRVTVSPTYWPCMWPSPELVTLRLHTGDRSALNLPVRSPRPDDGQAPHFVLPSVQPNTELADDGAMRTVTHDLTAGRSKLVVHRADRFAEGPDVLHLAETSQDEFAIVEGDPLSAHVRCDRTSTLWRGEWWVRVETVSTISSDLTCFEVTNQVNAFGGDTRIFTRGWTKRISRDHV